MWSKVRRLVFLSGIVFGLFPQATWAAGGPSDARTVLQVGPGFLLSGGTGRPGAGVSLATKIFDRHQLYAGIDSGFFLGFSPFSMELPALAMAFWRFPNRSPLVPTLGLSLGPILRLGSGTNRVDFLFLINPGLQLPVEKDMDLFIRAALGSLGSVFTLYPQVGATFRM